MSERPRLRILIVDDDEDICLYLKEFLTREGYSASAVTQPMDAIPEIKAGRCDLVLLDVRMPGVDGVSLLREIRTIDPEVCVIIMTAYPSVENAVDTMKADAFDYLRKPFELDRLRAAIQRAIREGGLKVDPEERLNQQLGSRIRAIRNERTMTLKQLATKTLLSVSLLSQIELGKSAPSVSTLRKIAVALAVPLSELFEGIG